MSNASPPHPVGENSFNERILELANNYPGIFGDLMPALYRPFKTGGMVCVGINPSYIDSGRAFNGLRRYSNNRPPIGSAKEFENLYLRKNFTNGTVEKILEIHDYYLENYPYYARFRDIKTRVSTLRCWQDLDVLQLRKTRQHEVKSLIEKHEESQAEGNQSKPGNDKFEEEESFIKKSVALFIEMLDDIKPQVVLVANTYAARLLGKYSDGKFPPYESDDQPIAKTKNRQSAAVQHDLIDPKLGTLLYRASGGVNIPLFYSSMLTGVRPLDIGSYARLVWHIGYAINQTKDRDQISPAGAS
jgi:hypothetical protein